MAKEVEKIMHMGIHDRRMRLYSGRVESRFRSRVFVVSILFGCLVFSHVLHSKAVPSCRNWICVATLVLSVLGCAHVW